MKIVDVLANGEEVVFPKGFVIPYNEQTSEYYSLMLKIMNKNIINVKNYRKIDEQK